MKLPLFGLLVAAGLMFYGVPLSAHAQTGATPKVCPNGAVIYNGPCPINAPPTTPCPSGEAYINTPQGYVCRTRAQSGVTCLRSTGTVLTLVTRSNIGYWECARSAQNAS